jgi:hypothetical protein
MLRPSTHPASRTMTEMLRSQRSAESTRPNAVRPGGLRVTATLIALGLACDGARAEPPASCTHALRALCMPSLSVFAPFDGPVEMRAGGHSGPVTPSVAEHRSGFRASQHSEADAPIGVAGPLASAHGLNGPFPSQTRYESRLRLVNLWTSSGGSSFSLQAGHGHEASLQWSMSLGDSPSRRGLLDAWLGRGP